MCESLKYRSHTSGSTEALKKLDLDGSEKFENTNKFRRYKVLISVFSFVLTIIIEITVLFPVEFEDLSYGNSPSKFVERPNFEAYSIWFYVAKEIWYLRERKRVWNLREPYLFIEKWNLDNEYRWKMCRTTYYSVICLSSQANHVQDKD